jgi:hypothetical protein
VLYLRAKPRILVAACTMTCGSFAQAYIRGIAKLTIPVRQIQLHRSKPLIFGLYLAKWKVDAANGTEAILSAICLQKGLFGHLNC